jgi:ArsR family transcriptional regulator
MRAGGRLLIADFAPHELEFLRTDFAHRRVGFSDREVQGWFAAGGLTPLANEAIAAGKDKLTVKLWLAEAARGEKAVAA